MKLSQCIWVRDTKSAWVWIPYRVKIKMIMKINLNNSYSSTTTEKIFRQLNYHWKNISSLIEIWTQSAQLDPPCTWVTSFQPVRNLNQEFYCLGPWVDIYHQSNKCLILKWPHTCYLQRLNRPKPKNKGLLNLVRKL